MNKNHLFGLIANFSAVVLLVALISTPIYFARNFAKVAGVKSESKYLIVSQVEKFPLMRFEQVGDRYQISFSKQGLSQAFLGVLIINNPTQLTQTYALEVTSGQAKPFFGEDLNNQLTQISLPKTVSVSVSIFSDTQTAANQMVEFRITTAKSE